VTAFLEDYDDRLPWPKRHGELSSSEILRGNDETGLSVVVASAPHEPPRSDLQWLWKERAGQSANPVLVVVTYPGKSHQMAAVLGPDRDAAPVTGLESILAERLVEHALAMESPVGLVTEMRRRLSSLRGGVGPGFRNEGLFATHVLSQQPQREDWRELCSRSDSLLADRGEGLLSGLGYKVEHVPDGVVLRASGDGQRRAAAVLLLDEESFDNPLGRFAGSNAVTHGLALARRENVPWLILLGGSVARLFPANPDVGVGRKGETQTFVEVDLDLLTGDTAGYLSLLFAPDALVSGGTVETLLAESDRYATALSDRLRDRIYDEVIPSLATAVAARSKVWDVPVEEQKAVLDQAYHQAMIILFRMLFVAYAEDRELLPLGINETYTANALNTLANRILDEPDKGFSETSTSLWNDLTQIWEVIDTGDLEGMGVPAYNGGLFTQDKKKNPAGAATYKIRLTNSEIGPVIRGLMIDITPDGYPGLVDFRSLDVREFGTIYEGLLESGLAIADTDLTVDKKDTFIPAGNSDQVIVEAGSVYFHSRSGSRKATGSYFTKPFAVQHLLDQALEPALDTHLAKIKSLLDKGANQTAAESLFDFRVADLSMGSAHFLVAAVDRIEARFSAFIAENPMPEVQNELHKLRTTAATQLGQAPDESGIDDGVLLRRQIARRCIYGIDANDIAVELARLAVWIHTFVPGLPLSFLNHGMVWGDSLTGVGSLGEIVEALEEARQSEDQGGGADVLFDLGFALAAFIERVSDQLAQLAHLTDASITDVSKASELQSSIRQTLRPLSDICDLVTAERATRHLKKTDPARVWLIRDSGLRTVSDVDSLEAAISDHPYVARARAIARELNAVHLPIQFPETATGLRVGFDVLLGNPPWDEVMIEAPKFWRQFYPGLLGMKPDQMKKKIRELKKTYSHLLPEYEAEVERVRKYRQTLLSLPYEGLGTGDVDLYQVFAWRCWKLLSPEGHLGMVFPRSLLNSAGTAAWRRETLETGNYRSVVSLVNSAKWVFDEVHAQYTIILLSLKKDVDSNLVHLAGPFHARNDFELGKNRLGALSAQRLTEWSAIASVPLLGSPEGVRVFEQIRAHPRLDRKETDWDFRPVREFDATNDRKYFDAGPEKAGRISVFTGASFDIWTPDTGEYYAWAEPETVIAELQRKRDNQIRLSKSAFFGLSESWASDSRTLPMHFPRIAFRDVCRSTDTRTLIAALIPGNHVVTNKAPYFARLAGDERVEAFLLGVLCSIPLDWYSRKYIEISANLHIVNGLPVPVMRDSSLHSRIIEISGRLAAIDQRYADWAKAVGVPVGSVKTLEEKDALIAELDALVSLLYGLSREQVEHVFATFQRGWDYKPRLTTVLAHYDTWSASLGEGK